jgi:hypothetical protein
MAASYDESPDINKQKVIEKQEKYHHCFVEKQSKKQEYLDSGGKVGLEGESGSNSRKKDEADFESVA